MQPEFQIIITCAQVDISSFQRQQVETLLHEPINWSMLTEVAISHGVLPLVCQTLQSFEIANSPAFPKQKMRELFVKNSISNLHVTRYLLTTLKLLEANNVPSIAFKGPVLALMAYGDLNLRQFSDIDILIPADQLNSSLNLLVQSMSYKPFRDWKISYPIFESIYSRTQHEYSLQNNGIFLDLHDSLLPPYFLRENITYSDLELEARIVEISGKKISTLGVEDTLLYLCLHGSKECWRSLKWICDVNEYIKAYPDLNWHLLLKKASKINAKRMLFVALQLVISLFENDFIPSFLKTYVSDPYTASLSKDFIQNLFPSTNRKLSHRFSFSRLGLHIKMMETVPEKINTLQYILYPIRNRLDVLLPNTKVW